ncbi:MAG TPA: LysR family transcriptional regulator [Phenylobacterium sp.]|nr:LysR family transcriptional regulator [Phenylobacterium sp.]
MPSQPDWDLLQSLQAVIAAGSLSAAAKALGLTQPTLGRHIDQLERQLGAPLFLRSPRGLQPTDMALALQPHLEDMTAAAQAALRDASNAADGETGVIRVTVSEIIGIEILPPILAQFRRANPKITIEVVLSNKNQDLTRRDADIAVRMARPTQNTLVARKVGQVAFGFYATPDYLAEHGALATLDDLSDHCLIGYDTPLTNLPDGLVLGREVSRDLFSFRTDNDAAQLSALRAGVGIGVCQHQIGRRDGLIQILPNVLKFELDVWICMHESLKGSRRMRLMFDHLAEAFSAYAAQG